MGLLSDIFSGMLGVTLTIIGIILVSTGLALLAFSSGNLIVIFFGIIIFLLGAGMIAAGRKRVH